MKIIMLPCVEGGIGHISRTATLARALCRIDPSVEIEYVLDTVRLRPLNIEMTTQMGYRPRLLPPITRENRDAVARACLGDADVIVDDTARYLLPLRACVPQAAWVSIPIPPVGDELFGDWPFMKQMEAIIWAYPPLLALPPELSLVRDKIVKTGPFLDLADVPGREEARRSLGIAPEERVVLYAVRNFPFGRDFAGRTLKSLHGAVAALRADHPDLVLHLLAVRDEAELAEVMELQDGFPGWLRCRGVLPQAEALRHISASDIVIGEGTSTMHEGAALGTPLVLMPGPISETLLLAEALGREQAAPCFPPGTVDAEKLAAAFRGILDDSAATAGVTARARALVSGGGGVEAAARLVLEIGARHARRFQAAPAG
ncbi:hypothetical protein EBE87_10730 [Pseudoroseomonas wenyumeiae]|uniref:Glycosyltransferase n=2 Tax=Teichococcus wenyumeiae TaxID=2478470 RepID=A0A3A9JXU1_9PROT|nr:hypothetical protein D6Z83_03140 [Pseudoroseomonas wenyumeiae]RMI25080.1 hypothetical protein EBE87_10730 [Pseudoroseomonas wenyumeiae]